MIWNLLFILVSLINDSDKSFEFTYTPEELLAKETIYDLIGTSESCRISYFEITRVPEDKKDVFMWPCRSDQLNEVSKQNFAIAEKGDIFYVEGILSDGDCLQYQKTGATIFVLKITELK